MKHIVFLCIILGALLQGAAAYAQKKTFTRDYTYQASEDDSRNSARVNATTQMRNILLREVGEFVRAKRTFKQTATSQDYVEKIEAITAGIVEMKTLKESWDGSHYYIQAEMTVDLKDFERRIAEVLNDRQRTKDLEDAYKRIREQETEMKKLQIEIAELKRLSETGNEQTGKTTAAKIQTLQTTCYLALAEAPKRLKRRNKKPLPIAA